MQRIVQSRKQQKKVEYIQWQDTSFKVKSRPSADEVEIIINAFVGITRVVPVSETYSSPQARPYAYNNNTTGERTGCRRRLRTA